MKWSQEVTAMSNIPTRETFESIYSGRPPWDIGRPQQIFVESADQVTGDVLDAGCGTGEHALFFASRGHRVLGIDFLEGPLQQARRKAHERGISAEFLRYDAVELPRLDRRFDSVIDSGLFHVFSDADRPRYVAGLAHVTKPGGRVFLACFSEEEPGTHGPRRVTQAELRGAFSSGWTVESIRAVRFEVVPDLQNFTFSPGGPKSWFATIRRDPQALTPECVVEAALYADDLNQAEAFYTRVLNLPVIARDPDRHVFFRAGSGTVLLVFRADSTLKGEQFPAHGAPGPGHVALGIRPELLSAWRERLIAEGVAIEIEHTWPRGGQSLYFRDPAGNSIELITPGVWGTPEGW